MNTGEWFGTQLSPHSLTVRLQAVQRAERGDQRQPGCGSGMPRAIGSRGVCSCAYFGAMYDPSSHRNANLKPSSLSHSFALRVCVFLSHLSLPPPPAYSSSQPLFLSAAHGRRQSGIEVFRQPRDSSAGPDGVVAFDPEGRTVAA